MAWWTLLAHDGELYMAGLRDVDFGPVVERGVYRLVDEKRVSISDGTPMDDTFVSELLVRSDA